MNKIIFLIIFPFFLLADELEPYQKICKDIGFEAGTEDFAQCVMDFYKQEKDKQSSNNKHSENNSTSNSINQQNQILKEQFEYQKNKDEDDEYNRKMGNIFKYLLTPTPNNNRTMNCYNYGTAQHPNVQCY